MLSLDWFFAITYVFSVLFRIVITSLGEERAGLFASNYLSDFVVCVIFCLFSLFFFASVVGCGL